MRVLLTGGTGFVGSHTANALRDAGHDVRLLVRAPERVRPALAPLGMGDVDVRVGDMTDAAAVRDALQGCDAVVHAASVYTLSRRAAADMRSRNPRGTEVVLGTAVDLGLDPIVHVSSYAALLPHPADEVLTGDAPVGRPAGPYGRSKADSERIARALQERGAPVVTIYPGVVWGPHDPHLGETARIALAIVRGRMPVLLPGGMPVVDVRDVAAAHAAVIEPGRGPRRFLLAADDVSFTRLAEIARRITGRRLPAVPLPRALARPTLGSLRRVPASLEGPWFALQFPRTDAGAAESALGMRFRPAEQSVADTIEWLYRSGSVALRAPSALAGEHA